jgi:hypothetical protein
MLMTMLCTTTVPLILVSHQHPQAHHIFPVDGFGYDQHGGIDYGLEYVPVLAAANEEQSGLHVVHVNSGASYQVMETARGEPPWELVWLPTP